MPNPTPELLALRESKGYEYPTCLYPMDGSSSKIAHDEAEDKALGQGWFDSPAKARAALERLASAATLSTLLPLSTNHDLIDAVYKIRYEAAEGPEQWTILREYLGNFSASALKSAWAAQPISLLPYIESWRQSFSAEIKPRPETTAAVREPPAEEPQLPLKSNRGRKKGTGRHEVRDLSIAIRKAKRDGCRLTIEIIDYLVREEKESASTTPIVAIWRNRFGVKTWGEVQSKYEKDDHLKNAVTKRYAKVKK